METAYLGSFVLDCDGIFDYSDSIRGFSLLVVDEMCAVDLCPLCSRLDVWSNRRARGYFWYAAKQGMWAEFGSCTKLELAYIFWRVRISLFFFAPFNLCSASLSNWWSCSSERSSSAIISRASFEGSGNGALEVFSSALNKFRDRHSLNKNISWK